jgi:quercetin dioxygenase-like cupin family protein
MKALFGIVTLVGICGATAAAAPEVPFPMSASLSDVKWGQAPPALPPGAQMAVMAGDPTKTGFVSLRAKVPAGYTIRPHFHPTDEHVTVLSGTMAFGMGDTIDAKNEKSVARGGYFIAQANMHHYAVAKTAAVLQIDLEGPFEITYVNPADDPRKTKK